MGRHVAWALPLLFAALVRIALAADAADGPLLGDEATLRRLGNLWATHGVYVGEWPPVIPWLLARLQGLVGLGPNLAWLRGLDVVFSTATVGVIMALVARLGGRRAGLVAGWVAAQHVALAIWSALIFTEALFVLVFAVALALVARLFDADRAPSARARGWLPFAIGAWLGVGLLVRAAGLVLTVAVGAAVFLARAREEQARAPGPRLGAIVAAPATRGLVEAAAIIVAALVVLLPWSMRSTLVVGASKWASATGAGNIVLGWSGAPIPFERAGLESSAIDAAPLGGLRHWLEAPGPSVPGPEVFADGTRMQGYARERVREVLTTHPGWAIRSRIIGVSDVFSPLSFAHRALRLGQLDGIAQRPWARRALLLGGALSSVAVLGLALVAAARRVAPPWFEVLALLLVLAHVAVPLAMFGISRFRAPLEPVLIALAALACTRPTDPSRAPTGITRKLIVGALSALAVVTQLVSLPVVVAALRTSW
ncbi:MAG: glycosyltransferase family 39 protein [Planctomycetota bacterium]